MKTMYLICALSFAIPINLLGQIPDASRSAITTLLTSEEVADKVFVDYPEGTWGKTTFVLNAGRYAFVFADSVFQKVYIGIAEMLPYTMATDGLLNMKEFYKESGRAIYIKKALNFELFTVFTKLDIGDREAEISLFTTSIEKESSFARNYVRVDGRLSLSSGVWKVVACKIVEIEWVNYFGFDPHKGRATKN